MPLVAESTRRKLDFAIIVISLVAAGYFIWNTFGAESAPGHQATTSGEDTAEPFNQPVQSNSADAQTLYNYGTVLQRNGKPQQGLPFLLQASELDPNSLSILAALAETYDALEEYGKASGVYARIRDTDPASPLGYSPASGPCYASGQIDLAVYWLDQGQNIDPQNLELAGWKVFFNDDLEDHSTAGEWVDWLESRVTSQPQPIAMQARHHYLMGDFATALQYSNMALNLGLPNRLGSDAIFMRIKRDEALAEGSPDAGMEAFRSHHPELFRTPAELSSDNLLQAVDLALLLKLAGKPDESFSLLQAVIGFYDQPWAVTGSSRADLVPVKAQALAILENEAGALAELRRIIDNGWRMNWRWMTELNFNFNGLRENSGFVAIMAELRADMAVQRANVQTMAERGEIKAPPQGSRN